MEPTAFTRSKGFGWGVVALLTLLVLFLEGYWAQQSGMWRDEALFLFVVRMPLRDMMTFLAHHESHPPFFYFMMRAWQGIFGPSVRAANWLPILFYALVIPSAYGIAQKIFSQRAAFLAILLIVTSPISTLIFRTIRPYSFLALLCLLATFALWRAISGGWREWLAYGGLMVVMLYSHNWSWVVLGAQWGTIAAIVLLGHVPRKTLGAFLVTQLGIGVLFAPWFPVLLYQAANCGQDYKPLPPILTALSPFFSSLFSLPGWLGMGATALLILVALFSARKPGEGSAEILGYWFFVGGPLLGLGLAVLLSLKSNLLIVHCYTILFPTLLVGLAGMMAAPSPLWGRILTGILALVFLVANLESFKTYLLMSRSNAREIAQALAHEVQPTDLVIVSPQWLASSFNYYFMPNNSQIDYPLQQRAGAVPWDRLKVRLSDPIPVQQTFERIKAAHQKGERVWLVEEASNVSWYQRYGMVVDLNTGVPPFMLRASWYPLSLYRTGQLMKLLGNLYGMPKVALSSQGGARLENLEAFLFSTKPIQAR